MWWDVSRLWWDLVQFKDGQMREMSASSLPYLFSKEEVGQEVDENINDLPKRGEYWFLTINGDPVCEYSLISEKFMYFIYFIVCVLLVIYQWIWWGNRWWNRQNHTYRGGGGGGILMIGMRTGRNFNRSIIRTGVRFMTSGGISIWKRRRSLWIRGFQWWFCIQKGGVG